MHCRMAENKTPEAASPASRTCMNSSSTSLVIKNIPSRATELEVMSKIDAIGFEGVYDFFYLPYPPPKKGSTTSNRGYAFINFKDSESSQWFLEVSQRQGITVRSDFKVLSVGPARVQGLGALMECALHGRSLAVPWVQKARSGKLMPYKGKPTEYTVDPLPISAITDNAARSTPSPSELAASTSRLSEAVCGPGPCRAIRGGNDRPLYIPLDHAYYADDDDTLFSGSWETM
eukprot:TRINITY_DN30327_c0_g1_i1.p1 TRINITY_DN30327_c0_g1~~TRINITY_DN30327_c0_g1_i1.p1  ORF type:complete len:232 (-),score=26.76 TRINITY_DN30327_c0_g1_i1:414-1109(-)